MEENLKPKDAAKEIGMSRSLLSYHMRQGHVDVRLEGGKALIPRHEVERLKKKYEKLRVEGPPTEPEGR